MSQSSNVYELLFPDFTLKLSKENLDETVVLSRLLCFALLTSVTAKLCATAAAHRRVDPSRCLFGFVIGPHFSYFLGSLPVWRQSWQVVLSQDAPGRLLVPQTVPALQGVPAPPLQIPHQEVQVGHERPLQAKITAFLPPLSDSKSNTCRKKSIPVIFPRSGACEC